MQEFVPCSDVKDKPGFIELDYADVFEGEVTVTGNFDKLSGLFPGTREANSMEDHVAIRQETGLCPPDLEKFRVGTRFNDYLTNSDLEIIVTTCQRAQIYAKEWINKDGFE